MLGLRKSERKKISEFVIKDCIFIENIEYRIMIRKIVNILRYVLLGIESINLLVKVKK